MKVVTTPRSPAEQELFEHVIACARHNDDLLRYGCLISWCKGQCEDIRQCGRVLEAALLPAPDNFDERRRIDTLASREVGSDRAMRLLLHCSNLFRSNSGWSQEEERDRSDFAYQVGVRVEDIARRRRTI
jgi:hypothetical protein